MTIRFSIGALALLALSAQTGAEIRGQWKTYPAFDNTTLCVVPTPTKTYYLGYAQLYRPTVSDYADHEAFLYAYDPEADETVSYGRENYLSSTSIKRIAYNPDKRYLLIAYVDGNIDLLFDDNSVVNIDAIKNASLTTSREPNSVTFDTERGHIYVAGNFGYVVIDENSRKVVNSRVYNKPVYAAVRSGDRIIISTADGIYVGNAADKLFNIDEYTQVASTGSVTEFMPLNNSVLAFVSDGKVNKLTFDAAGNPAVEQLLSTSNLRSVTRNRDGYFVCTGGSGRMIDLDGKITALKEVPGSEWETMTGSWDGSEMWQISPRKGLASYKLADSQWTATRTALYPNVPNAYRCHFGMAYSPKYGVLINNHEVNQVFPSYAIKTPALTSGLKNGVWTSYGYPYTNPTYATSVADPNGLTIDPDNPDYIYYGSFLNGVQRKNLADPTDVLHLTHPADKASSLPGYYKLDDDDKSWSEQFSFAPPRFDSEGNLWMLRQMFSTGLKMYVWPAAARKAGDPSKIVSWDYNYSKSHQFQVLPLLHSSNKNLVLVSTGAFANQILIIDTKGTPTNPSDDTVTVMSSLKDQDGGTIPTNFVYELYEDPATGTVWALGATTLYTFRPTEAIKDPTRVSRIKVARDDGTNLADYLLDNVTVYKMAIDGQGRKWFATSGGGVVVTSSDGKTIIDEITSENSPLPSDVVYSLVYNPGENSMIMSTQHGLAEFILSGSASQGESGKEVKVYPNPVRPDYLGWVTIEDLPENAVVKICDSLGNLVKELGIAENGMVRWDVTNTEMKRVKSGVYHIFSSSSSEGVSDAPKGKILVIN